MGAFRGLTVILLFAAGCTKTLQASAVQPNPLKNPHETLRRSEQLHILVRDMELPRQVLLRNSAYFSVVSRDRLRFHVTLQHKWEEWTDVRGWDVWLEDENGTRYRPESKENRTNAHLCRMWDREIRSVRYNAYGDIAKVNNDGYLRRVPFESIDIFRGEGDLVFHARDLFHQNRQKLVLVMRRQGVEYRWSWRFSDEQGVEVEHYRPRGQGVSDGVDAPSILPGPLTGGR